MAADEFEVQIESKDGSITTYRTTSRDTAIARLTALLVLHHTARAGETWRKDLHRPDVNVTTFWVEVVDG